MKFRDLVITRERGPLKSGESNHSVFIVMRSIHAPYSVLSNAFWRVPWNTMDIIRMGKRDRDRKI